MRVTDGVSGSALWECDGVPHTIRVTLKRTEKPGFSASQGDAARLRKGVQSLLVKSGADLPDAHVYVEVSGPSEADRAAARVAAETRGRALADGKFDLAIAWLVTRVARDMSDSGGAG